MCTQIRLWSGVRLTHPGVHHLVKKPSLVHRSFCDAICLQSPWIFLSATWVVEQKCGQQGSRWYPHHTYIFNSVLIFCSFCFPIKPPSEMADGDDSRSRDQTWGWSIDRHTAQILVSDPTCHGSWGVTKLRWQPSSWCSNSREIRQSLLTATLRGLKKYINKNIEWVLSRYIYIWRWSEIFWLTHLTSSNGWDSKHQCCHIYPFWPLDK